MATFVSGDIGDGGKDVRTVRRCALDAELRLDIELLGFGVGMVVMQMLVEIANDFVDAATKSAVELSRHRCARRRLNLASACSN